MTIQRTCDLSGVFLTTDEKNNTPHAGDISADSIANIILTYHHAS